MDEWGDDAYAVIYDEQDRERSIKTSSGSFCGGLFVFIRVGLAMAIAKGISIF